MKPAADESGYYATIATVDHAIDCLQEHADKYADRPFFHYVAFIAPHFPLHALPEDIARYRDKYLDGWDAMRERRFARQQEMGLLNTTLSKLEPDVGPPYHFPDALEEARARRDQSPAAVDGADRRATPVSGDEDGDPRRDGRSDGPRDRPPDRAAQGDGRLRQHADLLRLGQRRQCRDHGARRRPRSAGRARAARPPISAWAPAFPARANTPFRRHKTWVHEGGISTPLIVHWPAGIQARGELRHTPAHVIDIVPTILDVLGIEKPAEWEGETDPAGPRPQPGPGVRAGRHDRSRLPVVAARRQSRDSRRRLEAGRGQGRSVGTVRPAQRPRRIAQPGRKSNPRKRRNSKRLWNRQLGGDEPPGGQDGVAAKAAKGGERESKSKSKSKSKSPRELNDRARFCDTIGRTVILSAAKDLGGEGRFFAALRMT